MLPRAMGFALAGAAIVLQACASMPAVSYVHISDPEQLFSAADWTADLDAAVKATAWADRIPTIQAAMNETGEWPANMKDGDTRWLQKEAISLYNVSVITRLTYYDQDAAIVYVPAAANRHMVGGWKPAKDFFIVVGSKAIASDS